MIWQWIRRVVPVLLVAGAVAGFAAGAAPGESRVVAAGMTAPPLTSTGEAGARPQLTDDERRIASDLRRLAAAWSEGGGRFGYPFWDKAGHRWRAGEIPAALFREYVTGYRDRLVTGCELLDGVDTDTDIGDEIHDLVAGACHHRLDALRTQQRWLDDLIKRDATPIDQRDDETVLKAAERLTELEDEADEDLQRSFREAREAMNRSQEVLDGQGSERLREDAFL